MDKWRTIVKRVIQQQRMVRHFKAAVLEVSVPTAHADYGPGDLHEAGGQQQTVQFSPAGKLVFPGEDADSRRPGLRKRPSMGGPANGAAAPEELLLRASGEAKAKKKKKKSARGAALSESLVGRKSIGHAPGVGTTFERVWHSVMQQGVLRIAKRIDATKDVLTTYHESFLYGEVPLGVKVRTFLRTGTCGLVLKVVECLAAMVSVALYILLTYEANYPRWIRACQTGISLFFAIDYLVNVFSAPVRFAYIFSKEGFIDLLSTLPVIFIHMPSSVDGGFSQVLLFLRVLRIGPLVTEVQVISSTVGQHVFVLVIHTLTIIFLAAGIFQWVEFVATSAKTREELKCGRLGCYSFFEAIYFMVVTVATVGYGDVTPNTNWGRVVTILCIVISLTYIPVQINKILSISSKNRTHGSKVSSRALRDCRYVILWGVASLRTIQEFLFQLFHPDHDEDLAAYPLRVVIMGPFAPSFELKSLMALYGGLVSYVEGVLMNPQDLARVSAKHASAFLLLADKHAEDFDSEDSMQIIRALAVHRHCGPDVRVIVEMLKPRTEGGAIWDDTDGVEAICIDSMRFKLLARRCCHSFSFFFFCCCCCPLPRSCSSSSLQLPACLPWPPSPHLLAAPNPMGLTTLISNMFRPGLSFTQGQAAWLDEYVHGQGMEAAEFVQAKYGALLFALDVELARHVGSSTIEVKRQVLLYPRGHRIGPLDVGLVLAPSVHTAVNISKCGTPAAVRVNLLQGQGTGSSPSLWQVPVFVGGLVPGSAQREMRHTEELLAAIRRLWKEDGEAAAAAAAAARPHHGSGESTLSHEERPQQQHQQHQDRPRPAQGSASHHNGVLGAKGRPLEEAEAALPPPPAKPLSAAGKRFQAAARRVMEEQQRARGGGSSQQVKKVSGLEDAVEHVLTWPPPARLTGRPHPAVLERCREHILSSLAERTLFVVALPRPHILVIIYRGWPQNLYHFVSSLRLPGFPSPPVVIMRPRAPDHHQWGCVGQFPEVHFITGSPMYELDLMRAGVFTAERVVVLAKDVLDDPLQAGGQRETSSFSPVSFALDVKHVVIAANVERLMRGAKRRERLIVEVQHEMSYQYFKPKHNVDRMHLSSTLYERNKDGLFNLSPPFLEGRVFCPQSLQLLTYGTFYNRNTVSIVEQLVGGGPVEGAPDPGPGGIPQMRKLVQAPVPREFYECTWAELFAGMLHRHQKCAIGLYRAKGTHGSPVPYVYTNPQGASKVHEGDTVYVIE
eukprot:jgi/Mesen1/3536/ME000198S02739